MSLSVQTLKNAKLISTNYDKYLFHISIDDYNHLKSQYPNSTVKTYDDEKNEITRYTLSASPCELSDLKKVQKYHIYNVKLLFEKYNWKGKEGHKIFARVIEDLGEDKTFTKSKADKEAERKKLLMD